VAHGLKAFVCLDTGTFVDSRLINDRETAMRNGKIHASAGIASVSTPCGQIGKRIVSAPVQIDACAAATERFTNQICQFEIESTFPSCQSLPHLL
jgi:hypothetical protein